MDAAVLFTTYLSTLLSDISRNFGKVNMKPHNQKLLTRDITRFLLTVFNMSTVNIYCLATGRNDLNFHFWLLYCSDRSVVVVSVDI